jgi:hypothetical protein
MHLKRKGEKNTSSYITVVLLIKIIIVDCYWAPSSFRVVFVEPLCLKPVGLRVSHEDVRPSFLHREKFPLCFHIPKSSFWIILWSAVLQTSTKYNATIQLNIHSFYLSINNKSFCCLHNTLQHGCHLILYKKFYYFLSLE